MRLQNIRYSNFLYFAEKLHLERYGRLIVGDKYCAMHFGPVPSKIYDAIKFVAGHGPYPSLDEDLKASFNQCFKVHRYVISALREPDVEELSDSEIECLEEVVDKYRNVSFGQRTNLSHDKAWKYTLEHKGRNSMIDFEKIIGTLSNADILLEHLRDPYPDLEAI